MNNDIKRKANLNILITVVFVVFGFTTLAFLFRNDFSNNCTYFIGFFGIAVIVWCGVSSKLLNGSLLTLTFMFEAGYYLLLLGQSFLVCLNLMPANSTYNLYKSENITSVNKAAMISILCLILIHFGIILNKRKRLFREPKFFKSNFDYYYQMRVVGWIIFWVSIVPFIIQFYQLVTAYSDVGYAEAYSSVGSGLTSFAKMFVYISDFFPFSLFLLLITYKDSKSLYRIFLLLIFGVSVLHFSIGNRSEPICYVVAALWFMIKNAKTKSNKAFVTIFSLLSILLLLIIFMIIGDLRNSSDISLSNLANSIEKKNVFTILIDSIAGLGWCSFPLIKTIDIIPATENFRYGISYFFAFLAIFPNIFGGTHISTKYAGLAKWLQETLNMSFGPGYSLPAEAYYNFGWFGLIIMPFIGYLIGMLLNEEKKKTSSLLYYIMISSFIVLFSIPRRDAMTAIRHLAYNVLLVAFVIWLIAPKIKQKKNNFCESNC